MNLAARDRFARTLLDEGAPCRGLLRTLGEAAETGLRDGSGSFSTASLAARRRSSIPACRSGSGRSRPAGRGQSNKEIARSIALDPNTVKYHLKRLFAKLAVERRTHAVIRARQTGLIA